MFLINSCVGIFQTLLIYNSVIVKEHILENFDSFKLVKVCLMAKNMVYPGKYSTCTRIKYVF